MERAPLDDRIASPRVEDLETLYDRLDQVRNDLDAGRLAVARRGAERALRRARRLGSDESVPALVEALTLLVYILIEQAEPRAAEECVGELAERVPTGDETTDSEAYYAIARYFFSRWNLDEAKRALERCTSTRSIAALAEDLRGLLAMFDGRAEDARRHYEEAARIDPEGCPLPATMTDEEASALLEEVVSSMPEDVREALRNVQIEMAPLPDPRSDASPDLHPEILGLYQGVPIPDRSVFDAALAPDRVRIFKHNLERFTADHESLVRELRITLLHEVGHHLGWDEDDLAERGLA